MQSIPKNSYLEWPNNALSEIRKIHNLDSKERLEEAITILEEWVKKQDHFLKKDFDRAYLERSLITNKGSVEKCKKTLDRLCTLKTLLPQFFTMYDVKKSAKNIGDVMTVFPLPKLTTDLYRISFTRHSGKVVTDKILMQYFQVNITLGEYLKAHDYFNGYTAIYDFQKTNLGDLMTNINPITLQQFSTILLEGFGARLNAIHLLTPSKSIDLLVKFIRQFLSKKISNRIFVHKTVEELCTVISQDLLPKEYGGKEKCVDDLYRDWLKELSSEKHVNYMKMMSKACTDEKLRRTDKFNDEYMGMPGSFRNLNVD